jgi:energy-coupling factor transporter ATP-binding protein EcfA2
MEQPAICLEHITYTYPAQEKPVLDDINLIVNPGEFVIVIGPTGEGKSTLSLCLNGVIPRVMGGDLKGDIRILGFDPNEKEIYEMATKIGLVFQDADSQICNIFVREEVAFGAQNLLVQKETILERIKRVLHFVGLDNFEDTPVFNLSGGEKQRVAIASVLAMEPSVVVFDEPTANLDPGGAREVQALIRELRKKKVTVLVIEHDISNFVDLADRVVVLHSSKVIYSGSPEQVFREHGLEIRDQMGLRIPDVIEFALEAQNRGYHFDTFPLNVKQLPLENMEFEPCSNVVPPPEHSKNSGQEPIIQVNHLLFHYPGGSPVLKDISFKLARGEFAAMVGPNGAGKSTLTSQFVGLNRPVKGKVVVCGIDTQNAAIKELTQHVGYVFQYPEHQFVTDTVLGEMEYGLKWQGLPDDEVRRRAIEMLEIFQLDKVKDRHPFSLSRGQKRRLSVASMLVMKPELFILDEPTTGQDLRNLNQLMSFIQELNRQGLTILIVTHDMGLVAEYCDSVLVLEDGRLVYQGSPWELFSQELAIEDRYNLILPDLYKIHHLIKQRYPWLPPVNDVVELANYLVERE